MTPHGQFVEELTLYALGTLPVDECALLAQLGGEVGSLVGSDRAAHAEHDPPAGQRVGHTL